ncbi:Hypothetical_protein [Hexamita inflata]|uniref:Hypothetical_protein n=1 Tax=Hexamita inflata TaxID=28002 RepID=A0AA86QWR3_9EUKA|nr:Hypothetical protein HINF_LOCUS55129 [Hexamita inflata]
MEYSKLKSPFNVLHKKLSQHVCNVQVSIKLKLCADKKLKIIKRLLQSIFSKQLLKFILKYIILQRIPSYLVHQLVVASTIISFSDHIEGLKMVKTHVICHLLIREFCMMQLPYKRVDLLPYKRNRTLQCSNFNTPSDYQNQRWTNLKRSCISLLQKVNLAKEIPDEIFARVPQGKRQTSCVDHNLSQTSN